MNEKDISERLRNDMDKRKIPEFWDKIEEKRRQKMTVEEMPSDILPKKRVYDRWYTALKVTAAVMAGVCLVPIAILIFTVGIFGGLGSAEPSDNSEIPLEISYYEYSYAPPKGGLIEQLQELKIYGELKPSLKTKEELSQYTVLTRDNPNAYEDDEYLYVFDSNERLVYMILKRQDIRKGTAELSNIEKQVDDIFALYFPDIDESLYQIDIREIEGVLKHWFVTARQYDNGVIISEISITFLEDGRLNTISFPHSADEVTDGMITKEQALNSIMKEIERYKHFYCYGDSNDMYITDSAGNLVAFWSNEYYNTTPLSENELKQSVENILKRYFPETDISQYETDFHELPNYGKKTMENVIQKIR